MISNVLWLALALTTPLIAFALAGWDVARRKILSQETKQAHLKEFRGMVSKVMDVQNDYGSRLKAVEEWQKNDEKRQALGRVGRSR